MSVPYLGFFDGCSVQIQRDLYLEHLVKMIFEHCKEKNHLNTADADIFLYIIFYHNVSKR